MAQQIPTTPNFTYAGLESSGDFLPELKLDEGKKALVSFLKDVPGMNNPPFVYCKVHWNSEMGDNGRMFQCFGGSCCQQVTWQRGWGGEPGKFEPNKARKRYYIPIVHYCQDEHNPTAMKAEVKHLNLTWAAYDALVKAVNNTTEGLDFFERDITLEATKINGATIYLFHKGESVAQWKQNPVFKEQVESQLPTVAIKLASSMPSLMTEEEFMQIKPQLDAKVQAAMTSHNAVQQNAIPQGYPQTPNFTQPQVNIPLQGIPNGNVQGVPVPGVVQTPVTPNVTFETQSAATLPQAPVEEQKPVEIPQVSLAFDPNQVLK